MTPHENRNWHRRWSVDLDRGELRHKDGLIVAFEDRADGTLDVRAVNEQEITAALLKGGASAEDAQYRTMRWLYEARQMVGRVRGVSQ